MLLITLSSSNFFCFMYLVLQDLVSVHSGRYKGDVDDKGAVAIYVPEVCFVSFCFLVGRQRIEITYDMG